MTFASLSVTDDGDNGNGDWSLQFDVNGLTTSHVFPDDEIDDNQNVMYPINKSIVVPISAFTTDLVIRISGVERDGGFNGPDDPLATAERTFSQAQNFGIGNVHDIPSGPSVGDFIGGYSVRVRIECLTMMTSVVSLASLRAAAAWGLERENKKRKRLKLPEIPADDASLLDRSLRYLHRKGWNLKAIQGENYVFEGLGDRIDLRTTDPSSAA